MQGGWVTQGALPAGLIFIMFTLGIGLTLADFRRVFVHPRAFMVGILCHVVLLPLVGFAVVQAFGVTGSLAVGFMIVAACPTGTTSNLLTYFARGGVALALSFTAFAGLVSVVTVPFVVSAASGRSRRWCSWRSWPTGVAFVFVGRRLLRPVTGPIIRP